MAFEPSTEVDDAKPADDEDYIADAKAEFDLTQEAWADNRREFLDDIRFARLEEQWPEQIRRERELDGRPCLTLNQLHAYIFQIVNDARQNKPGITVHPVDSDADPETAEIYNGLIRHIEQSSDADVAYDTAMDFAVSGGFGYWRVNTRYSCDDTFDQDLAIERMPDPLAVFPDRHSTAADSSDWNRCFVIDGIPKSAFEKRWPGKDAVGFDASGYTYERRREVSDEEMIQIAEDWTRVQVPRTITVISAPDPNAQAANPDVHAVVDALMPDTMIIGMDVYEANKQIFDLLGMKPVGKTREVMSYKVTQRILSGCDVLETVDWAGEFIPIVPVWGEELTVEGRRVLRSLIRGAKDAQRMFNYHHTTATEVVSLQPKTPFIGRKGSFETDAAKWATSNTQTHAYIEYDGPDMPQRVAMAGVPAGALQLASDARDLIQSIVGIFNSSIGKQSNETSGVAINARDAQADTGSFHFHDNLNRAIRHCGRILLDLIPKVYSTARMLRILGPDGTPSIVPVNQPFQQPQMGPDGKPLIDPATQQVATLTKVFDLSAGHYDLIVKAGPSFASQREELVTKLTEMMRSAPQIAPVVMDLFVKNFDIPDAQEIAARIERMMPQQAQGIDPQLQQAHQVIQQGMQEIASLKLENQSLKGRQAYDQGKIENEQAEIRVKEFGAQTDRLQALKPEGVPMDPAAIQALVLESIKTILANPDMLGGGGASTPVPPQGLPPANNTGQPDAAPPQPALAITPR